MTIPFSLVQLGLSETAYSYSGVVVNNIAERNFTITNIGTKDGLEVTGFTSDKAEFAITNETCTAQSLNRGASCSFTVRFSPTAQGAYRGNIAIASNNILPSGLAVSGDGYGLNVWIGNAVFTGCDVSVDVTATDSNGTVDSLKKNSFILWQGDLQMTISDVVTYYNNDPVSVVVALDLSSSLTAALPSVKTGAVNFIEKLNDDDEAAVFKFKRDILSYPTSSPLLIALAKRVLIIYRIILILVLIPQLKELPYTMPYMIQYPGPRPEPTARKPSLYCPMGMTRAPQEQHCNRSSTTPKRKT